MDRALVVVRAARTLVGLSTALSGARHRDGWDRIRVALPPNSGGWHMRVTRLMATACLAGAAFFGLVGPASATTVTEHGVTETFHDEVPCVGFGDITITYNSVEHESTNPGGGVHATFTQTGTFTAVLDQGGTSSGKFTMWGNFNSQDGVTGNSTFTF